jgi:hypothetical protein
MLTALTLIVLAVMGVVLILLGVVAVGIRQEPPWTELSDVASSRIAVMARCLCGLHIRRPTPTVISAVRQEERSADTASTRTKATNYPRG